MDIRLTPPEEMIEAAVELPLSKSVSNRALVMNALSPMPGEIGPVAKCDDTDALIGALQELSRSAGRTVEINVGLAGTAMRFLAAYIAATPGLQAVLDGNDRMRKRPIGPLVDALRACGAEIEYVGEESYPPLSIKGQRLHGGDMDIDAAVSSQFVSALVMVAPTFTDPLHLTLRGEIASLPYLDMTLEMMRQRGISAERTATFVTVEPGTYMQCSIPVERDWSAASYWYEVTAISAGWITLLSMSLPSLQGDSACTKLFEMLGVVTEPSEEEAGLALNPSPEVFSRLDIDLSDNPDLAQTLAVTCCMLGVPFHFTGLSNLKIKETDRIAALRAELRKLSFVVSEPHPGELQWEMERERIEDLEPIDTYGDHRMAMAFAPASIFVPGLTIKHAEVVSKSYPEFWDHMRSVGFNVEEI